MTRTLSPALGAIVESLELEQPQIVTMPMLAELVRIHDIGSDPKLVAFRLRRAGWLLETGVRGAWEFAPGAHAGPYGHGDPLVPLKTLTLTHPQLHLQVALSTAAWVHGYADRVPAQIEVATTPRVRVPAPVSRTVRVTRFAPVLDAQLTRGVEVHRPESVLAHMVTRPSDVRSWASAAEWLPEMATDVDADLLAVELNGRGDATAARGGYLLQALRPDIAAALDRPSRGKTWFGPRGSLRRHSQKWAVADTLLPFDPATLRGLD